MDCGGSAQVIDPQTLVEMQDRFDEICDENLWADLYNEAEAQEEYRHDEDPEEN